MYIPFICLSEKCEVTDISPPMKPLPDYKWGKGFLKNLFGEKFAQRVDELCRDGLGDGATLLELPQPFGGFAFAAALRYPAGGVALYLIRSEDELPLLLKDRSRPRADSNSTPLVSSVLSANDFPTDMMSFCDMCLKVTSFPSLPAVRATCEGPDTTLSSGVGALLTVCCSLICALGGSAVGDIELLLDGTGGAVRVNVSARCPEVLPFVGRADDLMALAPYLRGARSYLRCASVVAKSAELSVSAECSDGRIAFGVVALSTLLPPPEFKSPRRESVAVERTLAETVSFILSSLNKQKQ